MSATIEIPKGVRTLTAAPVVSIYLNNAGNPYTDIAEVNSEILFAVRYDGMTVNIQGVEYWYTAGLGDTDLVVKAGLLIIPKTYAQLQTLMAAKFQFLYGSIKSCEDVVAILRKNGISIPLWFD